MKCHFDKNGVLFPGCMGVAANMQGRTGEEAIQFCTCPDEVPDQAPADRLAYACAKAIMRGDVRTRSAIDDALLAYLDIGGLDGPDSVPEWIENYERENDSSQQKG